MKPILRFAFASALVPCALFVACANQPDAAAPAHAESWRASAETRADLGIDAWTLDVSSADEGSQVVEYVGVGPGGAPVDRVRYRVAPNHDAVLTLPDGELALHAGGGLDNTLPATGRWEKMLFALLLDRAAAGKNASVTGKPLLLATHTTGVKPRAALVQAPSELIDRDAGTNLIDCPQIRAQQRALTAMQAAFACTPGDHVDPRVHPLNSASNPEVCARQQAALRLLDARGDASSGCSIALVNWVDLDFLVPSCADVAAFAGGLVSVGTALACSDLAAAAAVGGAVACSPSGVGAVACPAAAVSAAVVLCPLIAGEAGKLAQNGALPACAAIQYMTKSDSKADSAARKEMRQCGDSSTAVVECDCEQSAGECEAKCQEEYGQPLGGIVGDVPKTDGVPTGYPPPHIWSPQTDCREGDAIRSGGR